MSYSQRRPGRRDGRRTKIDRPIKATVPPRRPRRPRPAPRLPRNKLCPVERPETWSTR